MPRFEPIQKKVFSHYSLAEGQVGVRVQMTGAAVVAVAITQLAAGCNSTTGAAAKWKKSADG